MPGNRPGHHGDSDGPAGWAVLWAAAPPNNPLERERRSYARQHMVTHLAAAGAYATLWGLLDDGAYGRASMQHDPSTHAFGRDLDVARQAVIDATAGDIATGIAALPRLWRYSLLRCRLNSRADRYSDDLYRVMAMLGDRQELVGLLELITDAPRQLRLMVTIGAAWVQAGEQGAGQSLIQRAHDLLTLQRPGQQLHTVAAVLEGDAADRLVAQREPLYDQGLYQHS